MKKEDTICAIATAQGGAIGIIRVSGQDAIRMTDNVFKPKGKNVEALTGRKAYTITYGQVINKKGEILDEVLVSLFRAPHSYTGEDSVEISCHGSAYILQQVMQLLIDQGCRPADPGEFTQRAFMNGKMDLSQAEAVADLIASSSAATHRMAMNQMRGGFSRELTTLRDSLLHLTSLMELELDFSDHEELEFADRSELKRIADRIETIISNLTSTFSVGNAIKNGIPVAIIGDTNAGKSTLLNALLNEERAIVSDIQGTTRDVIEDTMNIDGIMFRFIDTAGIRETKDKIENIGIERTFQKLALAEIILLVVDATQPQNKAEDILRKIAPYGKNKKLILVYNKADLVPIVNNSIDQSLISENTRMIAISAKRNRNINELKTMLSSSVDLSAISANNVIVTNVRHYDALTRALASIHNVQSGISLNLSADLISQDLRETLFHLNEIVGGDITTNEVLENIFRHFCIGK